MYLRHLHISVDYKGRVRRGRHELSVLEGHESLFGAYLNDTGDWVIWKDATHQPTPEVINNEFIERCVLSALEMVKERYRA